MGLTLQLDDGLAEELRQQASAEQMSVKELAHRLMRDALEERSAARHWQAENRRRLELIAKKLQASLPAPEEEELKQLQERAYEKAAPFDRLLHQTVVDLRREIERLPEEPVP